MKALSRHDVRAVDRWAIETLGVPGVILMENAGRQVADVVAEVLGGCDGRAVAIVAGAGNNGGDGFVAARHLSLRGAKAVTFLVAPEQKVAGDARINLDAACGLGLEVRCLTGDQMGGLSQALEAFDVVIDAVGGTGISGALRGPAAAAVEQINAAGRPVVAVDIPTGLDCDTGAAEGPVVRATTTVTFVARKLGFDAPETTAHTGRVRVADIGIPAGRAAEIARGGKT